MDLLEVFGLYTRMSVVYEDAKDVENILHRSVLFILFDIIDIIVIELGKVCKLVN